MKRKPWLETRLKQMMAKEQLAMKRPLLIGLKKLQSKLSMPLKWLDKKELKLQRRERLSRPCRGQQIKPYSNSQGRGRHSQAAAGYAGRSDEASLHSHEKYESALYAKLADGDENIKVYRESS